MAYFVVACIQMRSNDDNKELNNERAATLIEQAVLEHKANIIILPEFFNVSIMLSDDLILDTSDNSPTLRFLKEQVIKHNIYLIGGSFPELDTSDNNIYNVCYSLDNEGKIISKYKKMHLFEVNLPDGLSIREANKASPGDTFGVFDTHYGRIGVGICYDVFFPEYSHILKSEYNVDMLVFPSGFCSISTQNVLKYQLITQARAIDNNVYSIMCSYEGSLISNPYGEILCSLDKEQDKVISAIISFDENKKAESTINNWKNKRNDIYSSTILLHK